MPSSKYHPSILAKRKQYPESRFRIQDNCELINHTPRGNQFPESKVKATTEKAALKSLATPEDVAEQIRTLALSKSITGQNVVMDCGIAI